MTEKNEAKADASPTTEEMTQAQNVVVISEHLAEVLVKLIQQYVPLPMAKTMPLCNALSQAPRVPKEEIEALQGIAKAEQTVDKECATLEAIDGGGKQKIGNSAVAAESADRDDPQSEDPQ